jgi:hypothetical protein
MLSEKLAVELTLFILGIKNPTEDLKHKILKWAFHSADTGMKYSLEENVDSYLEGHSFFVET